MATNPLDSPKDTDPRYNVPGQLRAAAKKQKAAGNYRNAKAMEDEAKRVELKIKLAKVMPGQHAVIDRMHARENEMDWKAWGVLLGIGGGSLIIAGAIYKGLRR